MRNIKLVYKQAGSPNSYNETTNCTGPAVASAKYYYDDDDDYSRTCIIICFYDLGQRVVCVSGS